ncbi:MAG: hypothetical protein QNK37_32725 [Acidobacteriota bacterium]|nr:hypothetical protein [Acidobacteriota bacterium]
MDLPLIETWEHDFPLGGRRFATLVHPDGSLIGMFQKDPPLRVDKNGVTQLRPRGQGPGDLESAFGLCLMDGALVVIEHTGKIKVFNREDNDFQWDRSIHRKAGPAGLFVDDIAWVAPHLYIAGVTYTIKDEEHAIRDHVKVYTQDGTYVNDLVRQTVPRSELVRANLFMEYHMKADDRHVYFIREDEPVLWVIDGKKARLIHKVTLETPAFYRSMPDDAYQFKKNGKMLMGRDLAEAQTAWKTSWSRITNLELSPEFIILQMRTPNRTDDKFALLFYDHGFNLKHTRFTDDLLLASRDNRLFFLAGGNPGVDESAENLTIRIREIQK